jgi:hypothetical protein
VRAQVSAVLERKLNGLRYRDRLKLDEAAYFIQARLNMLAWNDARELLVEAVESKKLAADVKQKINEWHGHVIGPVDPTRSTVATPDLLTWLDTLPLPESAGRAAESEAARLREQVSELTAKVSEISGSLDAANTRIQELSGDQAQGKTKTAMLQVIGGLVLANTDMDIHATRLDGLGKLRTDLQTVGVIIGEDALRSYLKDAASLIEKPGTR